MKRHQSVGRPLDAVATPTFAVAVVLVVAGLVMVNRPR
jgi:hypothetical protein